MAKVRILSASDIEKLLPLDMAVKAVENTIGQTDPSPVLFCR